MRVLIVDEGLDFGGSIVSTANLVRGLDLQRFAPFFVSAAAEDLVLGALREAADATPVQILRKPFHYKRLQSIVEWIQRIPARPLVKLLIYVLYVVRLVGNLWYSTTMLALMLRHRPDLVQLNNGMGADEVHLLCLLRRTPRVVFLRGYTAMSRIERTLFLPGVRQFVSVSSHVKDLAVRDGVDPDRVTVATPPAIVEDIPDAEVAAVRARHGLSEDERVFAIVGRVVRWKGQEQFLRAARIVLERLPRSRALVIGGISDGEEGYLRELERYVRNGGLERRVTFTGYRPDVHAYYRVIDVLAHCSVAPEPSGRVIFEAMSYGVPVVASCHGGPREFVDSGVDGFVVDPEDTATLAGRIQSLLADEDLRTSFGARAREKVAAHYNKDVYARTIEGVYDAAVSHRP